MTIVVTGGGSGGHVTPILAVAHELKKLQPGIQLVYIGQAGDPFADLPAKHPDIDAVYSIPAGKFRRYHRGGLAQLFDVKTFALNVRDFFRVLRGLYASWRLLKKLRPALIFVRGGYVGLPVALAAGRLGIPFITHDSDALPGLTNRMIARWAALHAVALPSEVYKKYYNPAQTVTVGVPVASDFEPVTPALKARYRRELKIADKAQVLFVIGGGLGAQRINRALLQVLPRLLTDMAQLQVIHGTGSSQEAAVKAAYQAALTPSQLKRVTIRGFFEDVYRQSGAANLVITRAGATNLAEFAVQGKACVVIPSPFLAGGHQLKNAAYLAEQQAISLVTEDELTKRPARLANVITGLLGAPDAAAAMGQRFRAFGRQDAALELAKLLLSEANKLSDKR